MSRQFRFLKSGHSGLSQFVKKAVVSNLFRLIKWPIFSKITLEYYIVLSLKFFVISSALKITVFHALSQTKMDRV